MAIRTFRPRRDTRFKPGNQAAKRRQLELLKLDTPQKVRRVLWQTVGDSRKGVLKPGVADAVVGELKVLLEVCEREEQDARLAEMKIEIARLQATLERQIGELRALIDRCLPAVRRPIIESRAELYSAGLFLRASRRRDAAEFAKHEPWQRQPVRTVWKRHLCQASSKIWCARTSLADLVI